jgi:exosortase B
VSAVHPTPEPLRLPAAGLVPWLLCAAGFAAMYFFTVSWAAQSIWQTEEQGHGPIIVAVLVWLFWSLRKPLAESPDRPAPVWGWPLFVIGLLAYVIGRAISIPVFEFGSLLFVVAGSLLLLKGAPALRLAWFPVLYLIFLIPLPGILVDTVTGPLKQWISYIVVEVLHVAGYPIARSGVTITIGPYQMLVADACSGLHSMFSLSALGTLFMYIMKRTSPLHNAIMLLAILPIAFLSNVVRVAVLVLITYHLGDEAGQGFLHGTAGMVLMVVALAIFFGLDALLARIIRPRVAPTQAALDRPVG